MGFARGAREAHHASARCGPEASRRAGCPEARCCRRDAQEEGRASQDREENGEEGCQEGSEEGDEEDGEEGSEEGGEEGCQEGAGEEADGEEAGAESVPGAEVLEATGSQEEGRQEGQEDARSKRPPLRRRAARPHSRGGFRGVRVFRPVVLGIPAPHLFPDLGVGRAPEALQVPRDLERPARR